MDEDWAEDEMAEAFSYGDLIVLTTRSSQRSSRFGDVELGIFVGAGDDGVVFRRTHKRLYTYDEDGAPVLDDDGEHDWEFEPLNRTILTFVNWRLVDRIESQEEITEEVELSHFADAMSNANVTDFVTVSDADDTKEA